MSFFSKNFFLKFKVAPPGGSYNFIIFWCAFSPPRSSISKKVASQLLTLFSRPIFLILWPGWLGGPVSGNPTGKNATPLYTPFTHKNQLCSHPPPFCFVCRIFLQQCAELVRPPFLPLFVRFPPPYEAKLLNGASHSKHYQIQKCSPRGI